jgi:hypothetical protein
VEAAQLRYERLHCVHDWTLFADLLEGLVHGSAYAAHRDALREGAVTLPKTPQAQKPEKKISVKAA